jgi:aryl-alcohol dehydrogenase
MKVTAAVLNAPGDALDLETLDLEAPREREIRVRLVATGVCHTDISVMARPFPVNQPIVLGHEGVGIVESVGNAVTKVRVGDRVVLSYNFCGECLSCLDHAPSYCRYFFGSNFLGQRRDGTTALSRLGKPVRHHFFGQSSFSTYCLCTEQNVVKVPDSVSDTLFELLGPLGCGIQTGAGAIINVLKPRLGESLVIFGVGAVGMAGLMAARAVGAATVIAVDTVSTRLNMATKLGATHTILVNDQTDVVDCIREITAGGAHCSLDTTSSSTVLRQAIDCLGPLGRCGFVGGAPVGATIEVDVRDMMLNGKSLRGIVEGDSNANTFILDLIAMQAQGRFPFEKLMKIYPFESINEAIADSLSGKTIKPVLRMGH